ncbi:von Willebrand factor C domain-containing protein 2-like [Gigantopelta aegis]|uniref:von Willebrand factor C domain-containing protein 2-like n=1 Tax=Gigantopelta aegis TaxID=1735272 RepID=UPI001B88CDA7|nr:von Willebrand factor C domain-containing protein 2-like [Gigantopelta aegis]
MDALKVLIFSAIVLIAGANVLPHATHCEYNNKIYQAGEHISKNPCMPCTCTPSGNVACAIIDCAPVMCVDAEHHKDQCCHVCPNGPNCKVGDTIIPANKDYQVDAHTTCRCSMDFSHMFGPNAHKAICTKRIT